MNNSLEQRIEELQKENSTLRADVNSYKTLAEDWEQNCHYAEKWRGYAEQKYDGACHMMANAPGPEGWEVVLADDGEKSLQPVNWKRRALEAESKLKALEGV